MNTEAPKEEVVQEAKAPEVTPDQVASMIYNELMPVFKMKIQDLSRKGQNRVMLALMKAPFLDERTTLQSSSEHDAFNIGLDILDAKSMMLIAFVEQKPDHAAALKAHFENIGKQFLTKENTNG